MNNWQQNQEFIDRFTVNSGWLYTQLGKSKNQNVFLSVCMDIIKQTENNTSLLYTKLIIEKGLKLTELEKDGFFVYNKQMKKLAYNIAMDIVNSIYRKAGYVSKNWNGY